MNPDALASWDDLEVRANVVEDAGFEDRKAAFRQVQAFVKTIHDARISRRPRDGQRDPQCFRWAGGRITNWSCTSRRG